VSRGLATISVAPGLRIAAPRSGVQLGVGPNGPVALRLFRPTGTRVAAISALVAVQVLAARAVAAGVQVRVITARPREWQAWLAGGPDAAVVTAAGEVPPPSGPSLVVDDQPDQARRLGDPVAWRCRVDIRTPATGADLRTLTAADVLLAGALVPDVALAAASGMGVSVPQLARLTEPAPGTVAVLCRGGIEYVTLDPAPGEPGASAALGAQFLPTASRMSP
jgi:hypothetical protein